VNAAITALGSILAAAVTAYATLTVAANRTANNAPTPSNLVQSPTPVSGQSQDGDRLAVAAAAAASPIRLTPAGTLRAQVDIKKADSATSNQDGPLAAAFCVMTSVGSYGGATKGCNLSQRDEGWILVANGRKASSVCAAECFNFEANQASAEPDEGQNNFPAFP
jgi:hypothetical protein